MNNNDNQLKPHEDKNFIEDILKHIPKEGSINKILRKDITDMNRYELLLYFIYQTTPRFYGRTRSTEYYSSINMFTKENILKHTFDDSTIFLYSNKSTQDITSYIKNNLDSKLFDLGLLLTEQKYRLQIDIHFILVKELQLISAELIKKCTQSQLRYFQNGNIYINQKREQNKKTNKKIEPKLDMLSYKIFEKAISKKKTLKSLEALDFLDALYYEYAKKRTDSNKTILQDYIYLILDKVKDPSKDLIIKSLTRLQTDGFDLGFGIIYGKVFFLEADTLINIYDKEITNSPSLMPTFSTKKKNIVLNKYVAHQLYQYLIFLYANKQYPYRKELINQIAKWLKEEPKTLIYDISQEQIQDSIECLQNINNALYGI